MRFSQQEYDEQLEEVIRDIVRKGNFNNKKKHLPIITNTLIMILIVSSMLTIIL